MATVKIKGIENVTKNIKKLFDEVRTDTATLLEIGKITSEQVQGFTRSGKSVSTNSKFPPLAPSTVTRREYLAKYNSTNENYSPNKSNLTLTGNLVDSITTVKVNEASVEVGPSGRHPGYKTKIGHTKSEKNSDIFDWLDAKGFKVFEFSKEFKDRLTSRVNVLVKRTLRKKISNF